MISDPCNFAVRHRLFYSLNYNSQVNISNKIKLVTSEPKSEPEYMLSREWYRGYSFQHFWNNCNALLGEIAHLDGVQQLCHQYYLQNGSLGAKITAIRIKRFLGCNQPSVAQIPV